MGYQLETTAFISKENYNALRIRCIMLILENIKIKGKNSENWNFLVLEESSFRNIPLF